MPCTSAACATTCCSSASVVLARATNSQSRPTSAHLISLATLTSSVSQKRGLPPRSARWGPGHSRTRGRGDQEAGPSSEAQARTSVRIALHTPAWGHDLPILRRVRPAHLRRDRDDRRSAPVRRVRPAAPPYAADLESGLDHHHHDPARTGHPPVPGPGGGAHRQQAAAAGPKHPAEHPFGPGPRMDEVPCSRRGTPGVRTGGAVGQRGERFQPPRWKPAGTPGRRSPLRGGPGGGHRRR